ncbi:MAG: hypothetical protein R6V83_14560 [Candidatus Thorarchaeota archaeon]
MRYPATPFRTADEGSLLGSVRDPSSVGLGKWASAVTRRPRPKAVRWTRSTKQKSPHSEQGSSSGLGESAAVRCVQLDLSSFGDETGPSDNNPAVAKTVGPLAAPRCDVSGREQEIEAETAGGTVS